MQRTANICTLFLHLFFNRQRFRADGILITNLHKALAVVVNHNTLQREKPLWSTYFNRLIPFSLIVTIAVPIRKSTSFSPFLQVLYRLFRLFLFDNRPKSRLLQKPFSNLGWHWLNQHKVNRADKI